MVISIHWVTALLVLTAFLMAPEESEGRPGEELAGQFHEILGLTIFLLTLLRLVWKCFAATPALPSAPRWMELGSKVVQWTLYGLLLATPLTAIAGVWLEGHALNLGVFGDIPPMVPKYPDAGESVTEIHTVMGDALIWLAGLHATAALFHHFVLRDDVLLFMLPIRWLRKRLS